MIAFYKLIQMVPMECRDPKKIKRFLIDIEKRVEINPSRSLEEAIRLVIQGLSTKHEALDLSQGQFTTLIADISGEVIKIAHDKDPGEISVVLSKEQSYDQLWFKVLFNKHYVFAQCKFHPITNYLELLFGY